MIRVYLDWNVFSNLKKNDQKPFSEFLNTIATSSKDILVPFSHAHLRDLKRGLRKGEFTNEYIERDLELLSKLTESNFLYLNSEKGKIEPVIYNPIKLFQELVREGIFEFDIDQLLLSQGTQGEEVRDMLLNLLNDGEFHSIMKELNTDGFIGEMFPEFLSNPNLLNFLRDFSRLVSDPNEHSRIHKKGRERTKTALNLGDHKQWGNPVDYLDKKFKTQLGLSLESIQENSENTTTKTLWSEFSSFYLLMDTFGFFGDDRIPNLIDDCMHVFAAAHCDVFVTDDNNTFQKAKAIFSHFNVETAVCKSCEFIEVLSAILTQSFDSNLLSLNDQIAKIITQHKDIVHANDDKDNPVFIYRLGQPLLQYFNRIQISSSNEGITTLFLYKRKANYSDFMFWKELDVVIQKLVLEYGSDSSGRSFFEHEIEILEINTQNWSGRTWKSPNVCTELYFAHSDFGLVLRLTVLLT